jgi:protein SCO1
MNAFARTLLLPLLLGAAAVSAQPLAYPKPPQAGITQRLGEQLPLSLPLTDANGRATTLGEQLAAGPALLVPGYYRCPELCGLVMHGVLQAVHDGPLRARIVRLSIDPHDTPATARAARGRDLAFASYLGGPAPDLHLLVGTSAAIGTLATSLGYRYQHVTDADEPAARIAHPAAVVVVTPQGRVSRYFMGVNFEPAELRAALDEAARGGVGTLTDRLALLCAHFDPHVGRHSQAVMDIARVVGLLTVAGLAGWCWRRRGPGAAP